MTKSKIISFIITASLLTSLITPVTAYSAPAKDAVSIDFNSHSAGDKIAGSVDHVFSAAQESPYSRYYYSDSYFNTASTSYNSHLATVSLVAAFTSFTGLDRTPENCYDKMKFFFAELGFSSFESNAETDYPPTPETIGVVAAKKTVLDGGKPYTLVAITVRGGGYYSEWASNFLVGSADERGGNHKGFYDARDRALVFINDYLKRNVEGDTKVWINGFSRGGAVAGILGAWFNDNISNISRLGINIEKKNIFTYTFEAPAATDKKNLVNKNYNNIFNLVSEDDYVPRLPFTGNEKNGWNFDRPGVYVPYGVIDKSSVKRLNEIMKSLAPDSAYDINNFTSVISTLGSTQARFLDKFIESAAKRITRESYVEKIEGPLFDIMSNLMGMYGSEFDTAIAKFIGGVCFDLAITSDIDLNTIMRILDSVSNKDEVEKLAAVIGKNLVKAGIIDEYDGEVRDFLITLTDFLFKGEKDDIKMVFFIFNIVTNNATYESDHGTVTENRILSAHTPHMILAIQMLSDSYYITPPSGFSDAPKYPFDNISLINITVNGKIHEAYFYKGDSVRASATLPICTAIDGWYRGDMLITAMPECSF